MRERKRTLKKLTSLVISAAMAITLLPTQMVHAEGEKTALGNIYAIEGNTPVLPSDVTWTDAPQEWNAGNYTVNGTRGEGENVTVNVEVYPCDEVVADLSAGSNGSGKLQKLAKEYSGEIITEYDIVSNEPSDPCYAYLSKFTEDKDIGSAFGNGGPMLHTGKGWFHSRTGDGVGGAGNYPDDNDEVEKMTYESGKRYRVRVVINTKADKGNYHIYVTDEAGKTVEVTKTEGNNYRTYNDGTIRQFFIARQNASVVNHKIYWKSGYATKTIKFYVDDVEDKTESSKEVPGTYTYEPEQTYEKEGKTYYLDTEKSGWDSDKSTAAEGETVTYNAYYKTATVTGQVGTLNLETRVGVAPNLPKKVKAEYGTFQAEENVTWDEVPAANYAQKGTFTVNGKFTGTEISVTANVTVKETEEFVIAEYSFDEESSWADATGKHGAAVADGTVTSVPGLSGKAVQLPGGSKAGDYPGAIQLPDDLLVADGKAVDDFTVSMFINRDSNGNSFAMSLLGTDGHTTWGNGGPSDYIGLGNKNEKFEVEYRKDKNATTVSSKELTTIGEWTHIAIVTSASTNEAWLYKNGKQVAYSDNMQVNPSEMTQKNNWLGRSTWDDADYKGTFDEFKVYNAALTADEVKDICDTTLYEAQIAKTKEALQITSADENVTYDKDNVTANLNLPTEGAGIGTTIEWTSNNEKVVKADGTVIQPSGGQDANVTLTATIKAGAYSDTKEFPIKVKALTGINFSGLTLAIKNAQAVYDQAVKENIYTDASLKALKDAIATAQDVEAEKDKPDSTVTIEQVENATTAIETAAKGTLVVKSFEEVNQILQVWYPLDKDAKDASGKGNDATATGNVTYDRENGAVLPGGNKFTNYISLPADRLTVSDQMTFSFWAYDNRGGNSNVFGIGSGHKLRDSEEGVWANHFSIFTTEKFRAQVGERGWESNYLKGVSNIDFPAQEWHLITCVLNGKKLQVYIDKELVGTEEVNVPLTTLWDADSATRYAYIGNCVYGLNGDKDYKGNIKDFRIYNASLTAEHVAAIYDYPETLPMKYAKEDLIEAMGAELQQDGTATLDVTNLTTTDGKLDLKKTSYKDATIAWTSEDDTIINASTGAASIPAIGEENKTVNLTAEITLNGKTESIVFKCTLFTRLNINTDELKTLVESMKNLLEANYTASSWEAFQTALTTAKNQVSQPTSEQAVADAKTALQNAYDALVDKSALDAKITALDTKQNTGYTSSSWTAFQTALQNAKTTAAKANATKKEIEDALKALNDADAALTPTGNKEELNTLLTQIETENLVKKNYTEASWETFESALTEAQTVKQDEDAVQDDIDRVKTALQEAYDDLVDKSALDAKITALDTKQNTGYTSSSWDDFQDALSDAKTITAKRDATEQEIEGALKALNDADTALTAIGNKEELNALIEQIEEENLVEDKYTATSWKALQDALTAAKEVNDSNDVDQDDVDQAKADLQEARTKLAERAELDLTALSEVIAQAEKLQEAKYTAESWAVLTEALTEAKTLLENKEAVQADVDAAKLKLEQAIEGLKEIVQTPKTYTVTFKDRTKVTKRTVESGKKVAKPTNPTRSGYKFAGWYADGAAKAFDFNTPITKNITLTAKWTKLTAISGATVKVAKATYTGKAQKPKVTVTYKGKTLKVNKDYKVSYGSYKKVGAAKVKISGIGNYTGTKTVSYNIIPKKNKITKLTNGKGKKLTVKFSKATGAKGYEVSYATAKNFKSAKKKTTTKTSLTLTKLKKGKTYYVRVRSYIKVGKKTVYSDYSPVVKKKVTK